jgi:hypothetical protein
MKCMQLSMKLKLTRPRTPEGSHVYRRRFTPQIPTPAGSYFTIKIWKRYGQYLFANVHPLCLRSPEP